MYGAIFGDIIGAPYEFDFNNCKAKDFPLFCDRSQFTDDSILSLAVADGLMNVPEDAEDEVIRQSVTASMRRIGQHYPGCGYGGRFWSWMFHDPVPYNSFGNGSAMRVSSVGWLYDDMQQVLRVAKLTAEVSHNHPEGIKGAQAVAAAIFLARTGHSKEEIRLYVSGIFDYDLSRTCDEIRPTYRMDETCPGSVPEAFIAFLESTDFEDAIRNAVSLGGDSDTIGAITGSMAEAFYRPREKGLWSYDLRDYLPHNLWNIYERFTYAAGLADGVKTRLPAKPETDGGW